MSDKDERFIKLKLQKNEELQYIEELLMLTNSLRVGNRLKTYIQMYKICLKFPEPLISTQSTSPTINLLLLYVLSFINDGISVTHLLNYLKISYISNYSYIVWLNEFSL